MYGIWIMAGLLAFAALLVWQTEDHRRHALPAALTAIIAMVAGVVGAKIGYVLMQLDGTLFSDGPAAFVQFDKGSFSYFFGAAGVFGGVWLSARLFKLPVKRWMNLSAPCTAVLIGLLRAGEKHLGTVGVGRFVQEGSWFARFPFAVTNSYGEYLYAVFYLEALFALALAVILLLCRSGKWFDHRMLLCAFFLAVPQMLSESLRARCMRWGFVRVEQLLCGLLMLGLLVYSCMRMSGQLTAVRRFWRAGAAVLALVCVGLLEYALDKTGIPVPVCYALMIAVLVLCGVMEIQALEKGTQKS